MNIELVIGIIGAVVGIAGLIVTIWTCTHKRRYPKTITYYPIQEIDILNRDSLDFSSIKLMHNGNIIDDNIYYIKGLVVCDGDEDLQMGEEDWIALVLPKMFDWISVELTGTDEHIKVNQKIVDKKLLFSSPLIKREEGIQLSAFIRVKRKVVRARNIIQLEQRLPNTKSGSTKYWEEGKPSKHTLWMYLRMAISCMLFAGCLVLFGLSNSDAAVFYVEKGEQSPYYYPYVTKNNDGICVQERYQVRGKSRIEPMTVESFTQKYEVAKTQPINKGLIRWVFYGVALLFAMLGVVLIIREISMYNRTTKIFSLIQD